jgi:hypothetical protein
MSEVSLMLRKLVAALLVGLVVASAASTALAHCGGWLASLADRHACCRGGTMASDTRATSCCASAELADDTAPAETRAAATSPTLIRHATPALALAAARPVASVVIRSSDRDSLQGAVPLYLRQQSLLI